MTERIIAFAENANLSFERDVAIEASMDEQIIPMFDAPRQVRQQANVLFR